MASFLQQPTDSNLKAIGGRDDKCWTSLGLGDYQSLDALVERGNEPAAQFVAAHVGQLDAEELEDVLTALGQFASYHMREFLVSTSRALTDRQFKDALTMLPRDLADDFGAQVTELRARRVALEQVDDPQVRDRRSAAITAIDDVISDIEGGAVAAKP